MIYSILLSIFAISYSIISFKIIAIRRSEKILVGNEQSDNLTRNVMAARNLFEYSIIFIALVFATEFFGIINWLILTSFAIIFIMGRVIHFLSMTKFEIEKKTFKFRVMGMQMTFFSIFSLSIILLTYQIIKLWHYAF